MMIKQKSWAQPQRPNFCLTLIYWQTNMYQKVLKRFKNYLRLRSCCVVSTLAYYHWPCDWACCGWPCRPCAHGRTSWRRCRTGDPTKSHSANRTFWPKFKIFNLKAKSTVGGLLKMCRDILWHFATYVKFWDKCDILWHFLKLKPLRMEIVCFYFSVIWSSSLIPALKFVLLLCLFWREHKNTCMVFPVSSVTPIKVTMISNFDLSNSPRNEISNVLSRLQSFSLQI